MRAQHAGVTQRSVRGRNLRAQHDEAAVPPQPAHDLLVLEQEQRFAEAAAAPELIAQYEQALVAEPHHEPPQAHQPRMEPKHRRRIDEAKAQTAAAEAAGNGGGDV